MGKASRDKGARRELGIVHMHQAIGIRSERVPLSGAVRYRGNSHDIDVYPFGKDEAPLIGEVKARANGSGFTTIKRWLSDADLMWLIEDREQPLVVLPWRTYQLILDRLKK